MEKTSLALRVRPAIQADARWIAALIHNPAHFHRHLDWHAPLDWLGFPPFLVLEEEGGRVVAALACPPDPPQVYWLRFFVHAASLSLESAWHSLWEAVCLEWQRTGDSGVVAAIALQNWLAEILKASQFQLRQHIVTLARAAPFREAPPVAVPIRPMTVSDLDAVAELDALAFEPIWRNSVDTLQRAYQQAGIATVIEEAGQIIGYQISTRNPYGLHLARLAVRPERQRQGLGLMLVADLLQRAAERAILRVTVNTQDNNLASLRLYRRLGFQYTGENYPVYEYRFGERREHGLA